MRKEHCRDLLECIKSQDYPHDKIEVVLIDSMSDDTTKTIMKRFSDENKDFKNIQILGGPGKSKRWGGMLQ